MRYCTQCRWYDEDKCSHKSSTSPVDGESVEWCHNHREGGWLLAVLHGKCGLAGRFWEPIQ